MKTSVSSFLRTAVLITAASPLQLGLAVTCPNDLGAFFGGMGEIASTGGQFVAEIQVPTGCTLTFTKTTSSPPNWTSYQRSTVAATPEFIIERLTISAEINLTGSQRSFFLFVTASNGYLQPAIGLIQRPFLPATCPVSPPTPLADLITKYPDDLGKQHGTQFLEDNGGIDTDDLHHATGPFPALPQVFEGWQCLTSSVALEGGILRLQSAYRTVAYQVHLREIWDKLALLDINSPPECGSTLTQLLSEQQKHHLSAQPGNPASNRYMRHTTGAAIDVSLNTGLSETDLVSLACSCRLYRPLIHVMPTPDRVHFESMTGKGAVKCE